MIFLCSSYICFTQEIVLMQSQGEHGFHLMSFPFIIGYSLAHPIA